MFIAALFTIARTWKQPKCPSTDEWIKKTWHIYTMEYYSAVVPLDGARPLRFAAFPILTALLITSPVWLL